MEQNFQKSLKLVLRHEGGYVDHPKDPGGATNKGVTIATFRRYVKPGGTKQDLRNITDAQVATVYHRQYWNAVQAQALPSGLDYAVFDFAVNSGPSRAAKFLQQIVGAKMDGRIGPATLEAVAKQDAARLVVKLCDARLAWLKRLKTWGTFGKGWSRRVNDVRSHGVEMAKAPPEPKVVMKEKIVVQEVKAPAKPFALGVVLASIVALVVGFWEWIVALFGG